MKRIWLYRLNSLKSRTDSNAIITMLFGTVLSRLSLSNVILNKYKCKKPQQLLLSNRVIWINENDEFIEINTHFVSNLIICIFCRERLFWKSVEEIERILQQCCCCQRAHTESPNACPHVNYCKGHKDVDNLFCVEKVAN